MSQPGMMVMLHMLGSNQDTVEAVKNAINKQIQILSLDDDIIRLEFTDGTKLYLWDDGQSCCEHRYITSDDPFLQFVGATLTNIELREAPEEKKAEDDYSEEHERQFLVLVTDRGNVTFETHNEHNGYYGGFAVKASATPKDGIERYRGPFVEQKKADN